MEPEDVLDILASSPDGVFGVDMSQRVFLWNAAAERILGWKASEVVGKPCYQVLAGSQQRNGDAPACSQDCFSIQWARKSRVAPSQRVLACTKAGEPRWLSITHVLVPSVVQSASALVHIFHDVTREQQTAAALAASATAAAINSLAVPAEELTPREQEILKLMSQGFGTQGIAAELNIALPTVRNHVQRILDKLGVHTRLEAVAFASRCGLLQGSTGSVEQPVR